MLFPSCSASLQEAAMGSRMVWVPVVSGPLAPYAAGFESWLGSRAYSASAAADRLYQFDQLSRWLGRERLSAGDLTGEHAGRFAAGRRAAGLKSFSSPQSVALPLEYLRQLGVAPVPAPASPQGPLEELLADYCRYLSVERGLSDHTVFDAYRPAARLFFSGRENPDGLGLDRLSAAEVSSFLARECPRRSMAGARDLVGALRSLLRYLHLAGLTAVPLVWAVPSVADLRDRTPVAVAAATTSSSGAPARSSAMTVSTSCPALARTEAPETGRFSSSLNFTVTAGSAAVLRGRARHRTQPPRGCPRR